MKISFSCFPIPSSQTSIALSVDFVIVCFIFLINRKFNSFKIIVPWMSDLLSFVLRMEYSIITTTTTIHHFRITIELISNLPNNKYSKANNYRQKAISLQFECKILLLLSAQFLVNSSAAVSNIQSSFWMNSEQKQLSIE